MRKLILGLLVLSMNFIFSQTNNYKRVKKEECGTKHNCNLEYYYDDFRESKNYRINYSDRLPYKNAGYSIYKGISKDDSKNLALLISGTEKYMKHRSSFVWFLFKDGTKLAIKDVSQLDLNTSMLSVIIDNDALDQLKNKEISKIRLVFDDGSQDYEVSEKWQKEFTNNLKCISSIEDTAK